jgi:hypothetical protein
MPTRRAQRHGCIGAIDPHTPAASTIENAVMPVSSQCGRESMYAMATPASTANRKTIRVSMRYLSPAKLTATLFGEPTQQLCPCKVRLEIREHAVYEAIEMPAVYFKLISGVALPPNRNVHPPLAQTSRCISIARSATYCSVFNPIFWL